MTPRMIRQTCGLLGVLLLEAAGAGAAPRLENLKVDLPSLIDEAARRPTLFAVDVPHRVTTQEPSRWHTSHGLSTWSYAIHIPGAVSLSFHATTIALPAHATLSVHAGTTTYRYTAKDLWRGELWSRIAKGDALEFLLSLPADERRAVTLQIASFQAGFRGFGGVASHPHYQALVKASGTSDPTTACVENYGCDESAAYQPASQSTVGVVIANVGQCTGTLLNDVPQDGTPYVLTARHCETGKLGGGNAGAASSVSIYWDALTPCGGVLGTIYDPGVVTQTGATTVVEQQDAWLLRLDTSPVVRDAYFAGFDASGGAVVGGYTIHHARSGDKQFAAWYAQALAITATPADVSVGYTSDFLEVVNQKGNIGPGASGSALFDQNDRAVGSLTLGRKVGSDLYGSCPATPLVAPNGANGAGDFTSLAAIWTSTADSTSSTGSVTLARVLDPALSGALQVDSAPMIQPPDFQINTLATIGVVSPIAWSTVGATSCTESGGLPGDGWGGTAGPQGSVLVTEQNTGNVTYKLTCTYPGNRTASVQATIQWVPPTPYIQLDAPLSVWVGVPWVAKWLANVPGPCSLVGGSANLTNLPNSGTRAITETAVGTYHYVMTCGSGTQVTTTARDILYVTPFVTLIPNNTDLLLGQQFTLAWHALADSCTPTGGTGSDGWAGTQVYPDSNAFPNITAVGTYTYGMTCIAGTVSASAEVTVTAETNPPYATLTASTTKFAVGQSVVMTWKSNITFCNTDTNPQVSVGTLQPSVITGSTDDGSASYLARQNGTFTFTFICALTPSLTPYAATPVTVTAVPLLDSAVSVSTTEVYVGQSFNLGWTANFASVCTASGGGADSNPWTGPVALPTGMQTIVASAVGTFTYTLNCVGEIPSLAQQTQATVTVHSSPAASGGGGGGGGSFGVIEFASIAALVALRRRTRFATNDHRRDRTSIPA